jgi:hypothetical protein
MSNSNLHGREDDDEGMHRHTKRVKGNSIPLKYQHRVIFLYLHDDEFDVEIECSDGKILAHSQILQCYSLVFQNAIGFDRNRVHKEGGLMKVKVKTKYPMIYNHPIYDLNQIRY